MQENIKIQAATKIQSTYRRYLALKTYGINQLPKQALENYNVFIEGNDPIFCGLPTHAESIALIGTSGMRSLEIIYKLSAVASKLIILDNSKQVINFWRMTRTIASQTDNATEFLDQLKKYVYQSQCNHSILTSSEFDYLEKLLDHLEFVKMKKIITNATIIGQSWVDKATLISVKNILARNGIHTVYAYLSNIVAYVNETVSGTEAEKILANIQQLNPVMAIHTDLVNEEPKNYFLITDHTPSRVKKSLGLERTDIPFNFMALLNEFLLNKINEAVKQGEKSTTPSLKKGFFNKPNELDLLIKKYKLSDVSQTSLEKGLRNAAFNNFVHDLRIFIKHVKNIDAQDTNSNSRKTALHWAAIKGHREIYAELIAAGASPKIEDANQRTAQSYWPMLFPLT